MSSCASEKPVATPLSMLHSSRAPEVLRRTARGPTASKAGRPPGRAGSEPLASTVAVALSASGHAACVTVGRDGHRGSAGTRVGPNVNGDQAASLNLGVRSFPAAEAGPGPAGGSVDSVTGPRRASARACVVTNQTLGLPMGNRLDRTHAGQSVPRRRDHREATGRSCH